jgi:hypothetical protein
MQTKHYSDTDLGQITATHIDGQYMWLGYILGSVSRLRKVSIIDPTSVYFDVAITATKIVKITIGTQTSYLVLALESSSYIGCIVTKASPTTITYYTKPAGITENPVDVIQATTYSYFLLPGITQSKIVKYDYITVTYSSITNIFLGAVNITNAKAMCIDGSSKFWIVTYTDPMKLVKYNPATSLVEQINDFAS